MTVDEDVRGHRTHSVTNQPPERVGVNEYLDFPVLRDAVHAFGGGWGEERLVEAGAYVGSAAFQRAAESSRTPTSPCCTPTTGAGGGSTRSSTTPRTTR